MHRAAKKPTAGPGNNITVHLVPSIQDRDQWSVLGDWDRTKSTNYKCSLFIHYLIIIWIQYRRHISNAQSNYNINICVCIQIRRNGHDSSGYFGGKSVPPVQDRQNMYRRSVRQFESSRVFELPLYQFTCKTLKLIGRVKLWIMFGKKL